MSSTFFWLYYIELKEHYVQEKEKGQSGVTANILRKLRQATCSFCCNDLLRADFFPFFSPLPMAKKSQNLEIGIGDMKRGTQQP